MVQPKERRLVTEAVLDGVTEQVSAKMPMFQGVVEDPLDLNSLRSREDAGPRLSRAEYILNGPSGITGNPLLLIEMFWTSATNGVFQRVTSEDGAWWRKSAGGSSWGAWRRVVGTDELSEFMPKFSGRIESPVDLDDYRTRDHAGTYLGRLEFLANAPDSLDGNPLLLVETIWTGANNGVFQRVTSDDAIFYRRSTGETSWGPWRQFVTSDGAASLDVRRVTAPLELDGLRDYPQAGAYFGRYEHLVGAPAGITDNPLFLLEVFVSGFNNGVIQRLTGDDAVYHRRSNASDWQPWQRVITSNAVDALVGAVQSPTVKRIITSTNPNEPLEDGDLLFVIEGD